MPEGVVVMRVKNKHVSDMAGLLHRKGRKAVPICAAVALMLGVDANVLVRYLAGDVASAFDSSETWASQ
jgi:hypothetical protein